MVRVGMIGCGSITRFRHAPEYSANPDAAIAGFFDPVSQRARDLAARFGGKVYESYEEMLGDPDIDAVSVCTSNKFHAPVTIAALHAGKHVLCEKPIATSLPEAEDMVRTARETGKYLMIGHNQRLVQAHVRAREILESGELGRILSFRTSFAHAGPEAWSVDKSSHTWFFKKGDAFMGAMGDLGIHKADLIRWLIGDEIVEVHAVTTTLDKKDGNGTLIEVDDNAICILKSRRGMIGTLTASWTNYGEEDNCTVLFCTKGVMKIFNTDEYPIEVIKKNGEKSYHKVGRIQTNDNQTKSGIIDMFITSIVNGTPPEISGEEGLAALKIVLACIESSESGKAVTIE